MKKLILLLVYLSLFASADSELLTKAVIKLIQENQAMQSEIRMLKIESERLKKLEFEIAELKKQKKGSLSNEVVESFLKSKKLLSKNSKNSNKILRRLKES